MSARLLLEIALRVLGLWFLFTSITSLTMTVPVLWGNVSAPLTYYIQGSIATTFVQLLLGGTLIFWAPAIAVQFYPQESEVPESGIAVGPGDVYRTACFVLGAYLLVATAHPVGSLLGAAFRDNGRPGPFVANAVTTIVYAFSGLLLVFGSRPIAEMLSNLRYDPDTIPNQQISLAMLLILLVLIAVVLGVVRSMSVG